MSRTNLLTLPAAVNHGGFFNGTGMLPVLTSMDSLTYYQLLRTNRSLRRLWIGQVISELGNWFNFIAGLGLVRVVSHGDPEVTTIILLARLVPFTVFARRGVRRSLVEAWCHDCC